VVEENAGKGGVITASDLSKDTIALEGSLHRLQKKQAPTGDV
jgi:hypothetical protein